MNKTIIKFLKTLNIDIEMFNSLEGSNIKQDFDVNPNIARFAFFKPQSETKKVSIADIVGYNYQCINLGNNLLDNLSYFFDRKGDSYHSRSVSMLDIPQDQIINELDFSFKKEPVCLMEADKGVYVIGNNGLHRFHILKTHYLDELSKINPENKIAIKKLREKYSFEANVSEIDYVKTYSAFLLNHLDKNLRLESHFNSDYELTGKSRLINYSKPEQDLVLTDDQLIETVNKKINQFLKNASRKEVKQFNELIKNTSKYASFEEFYDLNLNKNQKEEREWN